MRRLNKKDKLTDSYTRDEEEEKNRKVGMQEVPIRWASENVMKANGQGQLIV